MARNKGRDRDRVLRITERERPITKSKDAVKPSERVTLGKTTPSPAKKKGSGTFRVAESRPSPARKATPAAFRRSSVKAAAAPKTDEYERNKGGKILVPKGSVVVKPSALKKGIEKAKEELHSLLEEFIDVFMVDGHRISEIELSVSFDAKGAFMGIGVGGATSIKVKLVPSDN